MSSADESLAPAANVLTVTRPSPTRSASGQSIKVLTTIEDTESIHTLSPTQTASRTEKSIDREHSPLSPFYDPNPSRHSLEKAKSESRQDINILTSPYDTDIESQSLAPQKTTNTCGGKMSLLKGKSRGDLECAMWPGQAELKQKKKQMRRARGENLMCCGCMAGLNKKTKIWVKILIALVIVGAVIGVGVGVSKAVGGGVWKNKNEQNAPINT